MEKRGKTVNFSLPEEIIQHIQSFMGGKEAAKTSVVSKSWYTAWFTRPNLDINQRDFGLKCGDQQQEDRFWGFAKKTIQRYEELNLKIDGFKLLMIIAFASDANRVNRVNSLAEELIVKAMKLGAVDFEFVLENGSSTLPLMVLQSETLIRLSVAGIILNLGQNRKVSCSRLRSLRLGQVYPVDDNIIWDIISSCPLIEELTLSSPRCRGPYQCSWKRLVVDASCSLSCLYKLKSLILVQVNVDPLFFSDVLSNFPCLKDLSLGNCGGYNQREIKRSSRSLECITFKQDMLLRAYFDIPSIRKFKFSGWKWPSVSFTTKSRNWESHISITRQSLSTKLSLELQKLLTSLSLSKISISLSIWSTIVEEPVSFQGLPKTAVENLTMDACPSACSVGMECLFQVCRPKLITLYFHQELHEHDSGELKTSFLEMLWKRSVQGVGQNLLIENKNMLGLHDLEEVNVEHFVKSAAEWRPVSCLQTLLVASSTRGLWFQGVNLPIIRFQLRWAVDPVSC